MLSVVIPTLNAEAELVRTFVSLVPAAAEGVVREVVVVDGGSTDGTEQVADAAGARLLRVPGESGQRMAAGALAAERGTWLMFLPAGTVLEPGWAAEVQAFVERATRAGRADERAAVFRHALDDFGWRARVSEMGALLRCRLLALPYGNQGLILSRGFYDRLGGHRAVPVLEDVDIVRRIGRGRLVFLRATAVGSAAPDTRTGPVQAARRTLARIGVGTLRLPPRVLTRLHGT